jgi:putative ABC transport system permease protein
MKTGRIFIMFSFLAILLACLGLIGLITFITNKRTREIGIRKTFGASSEVVLRLLSREVIYLILISSLIAYPIAFFGSGYWLKGFAEQVSINPLIYLAATLVTLTIGWIAISFRTIKAASTNPAEALRVV